MANFKRHRQTDSVLSAVSDAGTLVDESEIELLDKGFEERPARIARSPLPKLQDKGFEEVPPKIVRTPLPKLQVAILCLLRLGEPVCFFVIFPFIPQMVMDLGVAKTDEQAGYYAGLVESVFALTQMLTILHWGRLSDRIGRKPVLLCGLAGLALSMLCFGLSTSFTGIIIARCIGGAFSANSSVIQAVLGEITDSSNQATAFALFPLMGGIGSSLGPLLGGYLANPAKQFPTMFDTPFHKKYPYFLACSLSAVIPIVGMLLCVVFLADGPRSRPKSEEYAMLDTSAENGDRESQSEPAAPSSLSEIATPSFRWVLFSHSLIALTSNACLAIFPLFCFTPIHSGGLGLSSNSIGGILASRGCITIFIQLTIYARLQHRFGVVGALRLIVWCFPVVYILYSMLPTLASGGYSALTVGGTFLVTTFWALGNMSWSTSSIVVISHAPSRRDLGSVTGLMETATSGVRTLAPAFSSYIFALSVDKHWLGGRFWWIVMLCISFSEILVSYKVKEGSAAWRDQPSKSTSLDILEDDDDDDDDDQTVVGSPIQKGKMEKL